MKNVWILASAGLLFGFAVTSSAATLSVAAGSGSTTTMPGPSGTGCGTLVTQSTSQAITLGNSVSCNTGGLHADNAYSRSFSMGAFPTGFDLCAVEFGIEQAVGAGGAQPVTVNIFSHTGGVYPVGTTTLVSTQAVSVADQAATIFSVPMTGTIPAGAQLVVEVFTPDGQTTNNSFFIGSNAAGQSGPSFIEAASCGITTPTDTAAIGFPNMHIVLNARGSAAAGATIAYTVAPTTLTFSGAVGVATAPQNVNVAATAGNTADLSITSCTFGGTNATDFALSPAPMFPITVPTSTNVDLPVTFTAGAAGARSATLDCVTNGTDPGPNFSVVLNGTGGTPTLAITPGTVAFGNVQVGQAANLSTVLSNAGTADLTITAIAAPTAPFALVTDGCTGQALIPTGNCTMTYSFAPAAAGFATTTLAVTSNAGAASIVLEGTGANPRPVPSAGKLALLTLLLSLFGFAYLRLRSAGSSGHS